MKAADESPHDDLFERPAVVLGAGAVGTLLGAYLSKLCSEVVLYGREAIVMRAATERLAVRGLWGKFDLEPPENVKAACVPEDLAPLRGSAGIVLITGRSTDTAALAPLARDLVDPEIGIVVSLQNGLGNWELLWGAGIKRLVGAVLNTGVELLEPGYAQVTVQGRPLQLGVPPFVEPKHLRDELVAIVRDRLQPAMESVSIPCVFARRITAELWKKVIYNCALNAPAALRGGAYRRYAESRGAGEEMREVIKEAYEVAAACGVEMDPPTIEGYESMFFTPNGWLGRTLDHEPSMLAQLRANKVTEIESLNGAIERLGLAAGVPTPVNSRHAAVVRSLQKGGDAKRDLETIQ